MSAQHAKGRCHTKDNADSDSDSDGNLGGASDAQARYSETLTLL